LLERGCSWFFRPPNNKQKCNKYNIRFIFYNLLLVKVEYFDKILGEKLFKSNILCLDVYLFKAFTHESNITMSKIHTITCHTFAVAILSLLPYSAWAQSTVTWDAGTDFIWDTTTSNWTGTTYTNGDDAQFLGSGAGTVTLSGTINPGSVTVNSANDYTFSGTAITGSGSLTKDGSGILTLSSDMTYTGGTTVNGGELQLNSGDNTLAASSSLTIDGASSVVRLGGTGNNFFGSGPLFIKNGGEMIDDTSNTAVTSINNGLTFTNGGTLTSNGAGNGTYGNYFFGGGSGINVTGNAAATISADAISINNGRTITVADVTGDANADLTISSVIQDWGVNASQLIKNGAGTLTLTAQNTYTGGTTVNDGILDLLGGDRIDGALVVDGTGKVTLSTAGHNKLGGITSITMQNGGTFSDNSGGTYVQSVDIPIFFNNGGTLTSEAGTDGNSLYGGYLFDGGITVSGNALATISANRVGFNFAETITVDDTVAGAATDLLILSELTTDDRQGVITKAGAGTLTLTGINQNGATTAHHDDWTINAGTLEIRNGSAIENTSIVTVNAGGTFEVDNNETIGRIGGAGNVTLNANLTTGDTVDSEISGNISGSGTLIKQGASTLTLSGDNSGFSGGITLQDNNSRLALNSTNAAGTGDLAFNGFQTKLYNGASGPSTINNNISTAGWFYWESGSKALEITGDWSNNTDVLWANSSETLTFSGIVSGTASTGFYGNGTIALTNANNTFTGNYNATLNSTIQFNTIANSGVNSSLGAGTQIIFDRASDQNFNGTFENIGAGGSTNRNVILGQHNGTPWARIDNNGTGALDFNGTFENRSNAGATRELRLGGDFAGENTISSNLSDGANGGQLALTKDGDTTWTLSGTNTYTGATTVTDGILIINGDQSGATGAINVSGTGILGGSGTLASMTVALGGAMSPGNSPGTQTIADLTWEDGGSYIWEVNDSNGTRGAHPGWDWVDVTTSFDLSGLSAGGFTIDIDSLTTGNDAGLAAGFDYSGLAFGDPFATTFTILTLDSGNITGFDAGDFVFDTSGFANDKLEWSIAATGSDLVLSAVFVPEPSSTALLGLGGLALMLRRKRS
jgi:fibronectin-binding autotransporter adhesin